MRDLDFVSINVEQSKRDIVISPEFIVNGRCNDLMIRGKAFYAVYDKESGFWSRDENLVVDIVDEMLDKKAEDLSKNEYFGDCRIKIKYMSKFSTNSWNSWQKYCKSLPDHWKQLDTKIMFANDKIKKTDYMTHVLPYPLEDTKTPAYDELISTLYNEENRKKLEWAVGCIIAGDSKWIQKFLVLYGDPGSGKSTVLNIIEQLFEGYWSSFESKTLASNADFALESFRNNPLLAIEHDGDLSHIEDNTRLNSIVSHETMVVNEKFKAKYDMSFQTFLFMASNKPVKITDSKSGLLRRLIDVNPTGDKISESRYYELKDKLRFELGGIAYRCLQVYKECGANYYSHYIPTSMIEETNDFYNFVEDNYGAFMDHQEEMTLQIAWRMYKEYCDEANVRYPYTRMAFKNELKTIMLITKTDMMENILFILGF